MSSDTRTSRVFILGNPEKRNVEAALHELSSFFKDRCELVGAELAMDAGPAIEARADRLIVLGGDGTLIGVARSLGENQIPLIGVNAGGKLGFLTEFTLDDLKQSFADCLGNSSLLSRRITLDVQISNGKHAAYSGTAINDCVIQAGPPFRLITLGVSVGDAHLTDMRSDGLIVCTPSGSTAHNLSAGGPIVQADVEAMVVTPLNPHSLTHKPIVLEANGAIEVQAVEVNPGSTVIIDGQVSSPFPCGSRVTIRRGKGVMMIVRNPRCTKWHNLVTKLFWGQLPKFGE